MDLSESKRQVSTVNVCMLGRLQAQASLANCDFPDLINIGL